MPPSVLRVTRVALDAPIALPAYPAVESGAESDGLTDQKDEAFRVRSKLLQALLLRQHVVKSGWRSPLKFGQEDALRLQAMPLEKPLEVERCMVILGHLTDPADLDVLQALLKHHDPSATAGLSIGMVARISQMAANRRMSTGRRGSSTQQSPEDMEVGLVEVPAMLSWDKGVDLDQVRAKLPAVIEDLHEGHPACGSRDEEFVQWVKECYEREAQKLKVLLVQVHETLGADVLLEEEQCLLHGQVPRSWRCLSFPSSAPLGTWVDLLATRARLLNTPASEVLLPGLFEPGRIFEAPCAQGFSLEMTTASTAPMKYEGLHVAGIQVDCAKLDDRNQLVPAPGLHPLPMFHWHDTERRRMSVTALQTLPVTFRVLREKPGDDLPKARVPIDTWWRARGVLCCLA